MSMFDEYTVSKFVLVRGVKCPRCGAEEGQQCWADKFTVYANGLQFKEQHASSHRERFERFEKLATCDPMVKVSSIKDELYIFPGALVELAYGERLWVLGWGSNGYILGHLFKNQLGGLTAKPICEVAKSQILRRIELE